MDPEYIKDEEKLVEHLGDFIYDIIYGSIHNLHVQAFHQTAEIYTKLKTLVKVA